MTERGATIHFERLLNRSVRGVDGKSVGRIEEAVVERDGEVKEFHVGVAALMERLAASVVSVVGVSLRRRGYAVAWNQIDFSDPKHPRLLCDVSDLRPLP